MSDDMEIIYKIQAGKNHYYKNIISKYEKPLFSFIFQMVGNYHNAQDITQEVFIKAFQGLNNFKPEAKFSTWLYKIARNSCIDYIRKNKAQITLTEQNIINIQSPEDTFITMEFYSDLSQALMNLNEEHKTVFCLRVYQGFSYEEIAEIVACPLGTVRSRLARARESLRKQLQPHFEGKQKEVKGYAL